MNSLNLAIPTFILIIYTSSLVNAQQFYTGDPEAACYDSSNSNNAPTIYLGYDCSNGPKSCKTNLSIRSQYPHNTLFAIASLLRVKIKDIAQANPQYQTNNVVKSNKLVYIPITCSCGHNHLYFKSTTRIVDQGDSLFYMANNTYQGLTTCQAIRAVNNLTPGDFFVGKNIIIPLRCACPTTNQQTIGITSVFSYVVGEGDTISSISAHLKVDTKSILEANRLSENSVVYPFTTLLIPVVDDNQSTPQTAGGAGATLAKANKIRDIITIAFASLILLGLGAGAAVTLHFRGTLNCCSYNHIYKSKEVKMTGLPITNNDKNGQKVPHDAS